MFARGAAITDGLWVFATNLAPRIGRWLEWLEDAITFLAALLPGLAGVRATGDFRNGSEQSTKTAASLPA
jgi:hypothetical protein